MGISTTMLQLNPGRACLFLLVRTHSQMQYYLNLSNSRRAANDAALAPEARRGNIVEIHPLSQGSLRR